MYKKIKLIGIFGAWMLLFSALPSKATLITYDFTASIDSVSSGLSGDVSNGDVLYGSYTFDTSAAVLGNPDYIYYGAITNLSFTLNGNNPNQNESGPGSRIITFYDEGYLGSPYDEYEARIRFDRFASSSVIGNYVSRDFEFTLLYPDSAFDVSNLDLISTFLPGENTPLAGSFQLSFITDIYGNSADELLTGTITSFAGNTISSPVPVPAAFWLFGSGLFALVGIARSESKEV